MNFQKQRESAVDS